IPLLFMFVTAFTAGIYNIFVFYLPKGEYLLAVCSVVMIVLIVFVIVNSVRSWIRILSGSKNALSTE
ncbi:MAG: hypothetical protein PHU66_08460, partial [Bacteroidaceae bacterium]|nr:hypothetical protein [Bacteroidaceae bacterium]